MMLWARSEGKVSTDRARGLERRPSRGALLLRQNTELLMKAQKEF